MAQRRQARGKVIVGSLDAGRKRGTPAQNPAAALQIAQSLISAGKYEPAIAMLRSIPGMPPRVAALLGLCHMNRGDNAAAISVFEEALKSDSNNRELLKNLAIACVLGNRHADAVTIAERLLTWKPDDAPLYDVLSYGYGYLENLEKARENGERSLLLKDGEATADPPSFSLPPEPAPPFSRDRRDNIIAYSLWGDKPHYVGNLIENARLAPHIYPEWSVRVYCDDTVPTDARKVLADLGVDLRSMPRAHAVLDGLYWRFQVINDPKGRRFLVRDCDSLLNVQERAAVDQWLASGKYFHVMRDYFTHTALIMAGMWGGCCGILPPLANLRKAFRPRQLVTSQIDQWFLGSMIWPLIKSSCFIHDSLFRVFGSVPFPEYGRLPPGKHVGLSLRARYQPPRTRLKVTQTATPQPFTARKTISGKFSAQVSRAKK